MSISNLVDSLMFSFACILFTLLVATGCHMRLDDLEPFQKSERVALIVIAGTSWLFFAFNVANLFSTSWSMFCLWRA